MADHQPLNRFDNEGLSGTSSCLSDCVTISAGVAFLLRENAKSRGRFTGELGRDGPAVDEDSEADIGYGTPLPGPSLFVRLSKLRRSSSLRTLIMSSSRTPRGLNFRLPSRMTFSNLARLAINFNLGNADCWPTCIIRHNRCGVGSESIKIKSDGIDLGQMVMVPLKRCSHSSLQSWPSGRGSSSKWRRTFSHLYRSSLRYCSMAEPRKPPLQPRPRLWVTGRPTDPRDEKKKMLMCGLTWLTIEKRTLKWRLRAFRGMSVLQSTKSAPVHKWD